MAMEMVNIGQLQPWLEMVNHGLYNPGWKLLITATTIIMLTMVDYDIFVFSSDLNCVSIIYMYINKQITNLTLSNIHTF